MTTSEDVVYNGKPVKPDPNDMTITLNGVDVTSQIRVSFPTPSVDAGKGTMTLTPGTNTKNFTGSTTAEYTIHPADLTGILKVYDKNGNRIDVTEEEFTYEAKEFTFADAEFIPSGKNADLVTEDDYEITYIDNKYGPTAYICVVGKNNFAGTAQITNAENEVVKSVVDGTAYAFKINPYTIKEQHVTINDAEYAGGVAVTPNVTVSISGRTLVEGEDYVLDYASVSDLTDGKTLKVTVSSFFCVSLQ